MTQHHKEGIFVSILLIFLVYTCIYQPQVYHHHLSSELNKEYALLHQQHLKFSNYKTSDIHLDVFNAIPDLKRIEDHGSRGVNLQLNNTTSPELLPPLFTILTTLDHKLSTISITQQPEPFLQLLWESDT